MEPSAASTAFARRTLLTVAAAALALACSDQASPPSKQVILIGVDGATWEIIDELRSQGRLPTFDRLVRSGARGELDVPTASISPSLWTTIASGVPPQVHGIEDFWASSSLVAAKRIWEIADEEGLVSGALGYLVTWPPVKETGFLVPGWLSQDNQTIPPDVSFLKDLEALEHSTEGVSVFEMAGITISAVQRGARPGTISSLLHFLLLQTFGQDDRVALDLVRRETLTELSADVFCSLLAEHQPGLGIFYQHHVDAIEHLHFADYRPEAFPDVPAAASELAREAIPRIYESTDRAIQTIESCASDDAVFLILSDHGQRPGNTYKMGKIKSTTLLKHLGLDTALRATTIGDVVLLRARDPSYDMARVREALRRVTWARGRRAVFDITPHESGGLQLLFRPMGRETEMRIGDRLVPHSELIDASALSGTHSDKAIVLMVGRDIVPGHALPTGTLLDVAPTVLALLGLPVGRDMEGRMMLEALRPEARDRLGIEFVDSHGAPTRLDGRPPGDVELNEETRKKLRSLGYIE